jgi:hypothetical protein
MVVQGAQQSVTVEVNGNPTITTADSVALVSLYTPPMAQAGTNNPTGSQVQPIRGSELA